MTTRGVLVMLATGAAVVAGILSSTAARAAAAQAWPPFLLVAGLLAIGAIAHADGLFEAMGHAIGGLRAPRPVLLILLLLAVAAVTVVLNLDTAAAFMTPVVILAARRHGAEESPFLYGTLFMANAASLLLPGSNLTNLLVLAHEHVPGLTFAARMLPAWVAAVGITIGFALALQWRQRGPGGGRGDDDAPARSGWLAPVAVALAGGLVVTLRSPAVPVAVVAVVAGTVHVRSSASRLRAMVEAVEPTALGGLYCLAVALGTVARSWSAPSHLVAGAGRVGTVVLAALASVAVNNLPAAVVLTARGVAHPRALLLGLDLGPNLAVTGSLSALVWLKAARTVGARPSWRRVTTLGAVLVPLSLAGAAAALWLVIPGRF